MDIAISGIRAAGLRLAVSANNVANVNTPDFKASRAVHSEQPTGRGTRINIQKTDYGTDLATEMIDQLITLRYTQANVAVIRFEAERTGDMINMFA